MSIQRISESHTVGDMFPVWLEQLRVRSEHTPGQPGSLDGDMTIEALPTWYAGVTFRSALEAGWAATLDSLDIVWEYEPETIALDSGGHYVPDFRLPALGTWLEVKGTGVPRVEKAQELGRMLACHCDTDCTCEWPGGQLVLIGHPPERYNAWADQANEDAPLAALTHIQRRHGGHPAWSTTHGRPARLTRCHDCWQASWFRMQAPIGCRACGSRLGGAHAYASGDTDLRFLNPSCRPAPETREAA